MKIKILASLITSAVIMIATSAPVMAESICRAGTVPEMTACIEKLNAGVVSAIEVTQKIACNTAVPCPFVIQGAIKGQIFGTPGLDIGITRTGTYSNPIFHVISSSNVTISNLTFTDDPNSPCLSSCNSQISVDDSQNIILSQIKLLNSKTQAIVSANNTNFVFRNSYLANTFVQGFWSPLDENSWNDGVIIEGNTFADTGAAAAFITGKNVTIKNNYFTHNQWNPPWITQGGQTNITGVQGLLFTGNEIANGAYTNHYTSGIEISTGYMSTGITISYNNIHDNTGWGIVADPLVSASIDPVADAVIKNNQLANNFVPQIVDLTDRNMWSLQNNCLNSACNLPAFGNLDVSPIPCYIDTGKSTCSAVISWKTNFATNVQVKIGDSIIAQGASGTKLIAWVTEMPQTISLVGSGQILATKSIYGTKIGDVSQKPGDLNSDGKVDLNDVTILNDNFGNPYTIFDYNNLVANFGK